jgi:dUTP pyrophosphatase
MKNSDWVKVEVKKMHEIARIPGYAHEGDAAMDLYSVETITIHPATVNKIPTGIAVAIPSGYWGLIKDKSGRAASGLHCLGGVIDSGYRGELIIIVTNHHSAPLTIEAGEKVAQMVIQKVEQPELVEVEELDQTSRSTGGFGSTGLK